MLQKDHKCGKASSNICCLKQLKNFNHLNKASGRHRSAASRYLEVANIHTKIGLQKKKNICRHLGQVGYVAIFGLLKIGLGFFWAVSHAAIMNAQKAILIKQTQICRYTFTFGLKKIKNFKIHQNSTCLPKRAEDRVTSTSSLCPSSFERVQNAFLPLWKLYLGFTGM